jgi:hypothetical protein
VPHFWQNFVPSGFMPPHFGQNIISSLCAAARLHTGNRPDARNDFEARLRWTYPSNSNSLPHFTWHFDKIQAGAAHLLIKMP